MAFVERDVKGRVVVLDRVAGRDCAALMVDGRLEDLFVDPPETATCLPGDIYRGIVARPMKGQGAVMVRLPNGHGFLKRAKGLPQGQPVLVQVTAPPMGGKAAPVTTRLLFKGRTAIVTPDAPGVNAARSIREPEARARLIAHAQREMAGAPAGMGLILRSAAAMAEEDEVAAEIAALRDLAHSVLADRGTTPERLVAAPGAWGQAWRDWAMPPPDAVIDDTDAFDALDIRGGIDALLSRHVRLPEGGSAMIEPTAALIAIDVDTGGDTGFAAGLKANLALARELPRQLRLRGLAGQITIDVAPMAQKDRQIFEDHLRKGFCDAPGETVLAGWTPLGHFELRRQRDRWPLAEIWPG